MSGRLSDWETRFAVYLAGERSRIANGGEFYCALFASGAVEAVTGDNPAAAFRGRYAEVAETLEETIDGLFPKIPPSLAQRGDLAWHGGGVGIVIGGEALFVTETEPRELVRVPRAEWSKAWGVGRG